MELELKRVANASRLSPVVWQAAGYDRKFVVLDQLARMVSERLTLRELWEYFCECNTTEFSRFVPWIAVQRYGEVHVPEWGKGPTDEDLKKRVFVDALWAWDVLTLRRLGVHHVNGSWHAHPRYRRWTNSPCGRGNFLCVWRASNHHSLIRASGYVALFAYDRSNEILEMKSLTLRQPQPKKKGEKIAPGLVLGSPVPASNAGPPLRDEKPGKP